MSEFFGPAIATQGGRARALFDAAGPATCELFPDAADYIRSTLCYQAEYMVPVMAWLLDNRQITNVVDIGFGYGTFPYMCSLAGINVIGVEYSARTDVYPFPVLLLNAMDREAGIAADLPGGDDTLYTCMEVVEHQTQNMLPGFTGLFAQRPGWAFFTTSLAGTQGCPARTPWVDMPEWDGDDHGTKHHLTGWLLEDLDLLVSELGYNPVVSEAIPTCAHGNQKARLIVMGKNKQ